MALILIELTQNYNLSRSIPLPRCDSSSSDRPQIELLDDWLLKRQFQATNNLRAHAINPVRSRRFLIDFFFIYSIKFQDNLI